MLEQMKVSVFTRWAELAAQVVEHETTDLKDTGSYLRSSERTEQPTIFWTQKLGL